MGVWRPSNVIADTSGFWFWLKPFWWISNAQLSAPTSPVAQARRNAKPSLKVWVGGVLQLKITLFTKTAYEHKSYACYTLTVLLNQNCEPENQNCGVSLITAAAMNASDNVWPPDTIFLFRNNENMNRSINRFCFCDLRNTQTRPSTMRQIVLG